MNVHFYTVRETESTKTTYVDVTNYMFIRALPTIYFVYKH